MDKKLSATMRGALLTAGYAIKGNELVDVDGLSPPCGSGGTVLAFAAALSNSEWDKTEKSARGVLAAYLEDAKVEIGRMQEALALA